MTFMENLEPLVNAAEKYAAVASPSATATLMEAVSLREADERFSSKETEAALALLVAAIEFAKWGK